MPKQKHHPHCSQQQHWLVRLFVYTAHQFSVVILAPHHAVVDNDIEENDGHPHGIAKQLKLTLSQQAVVAIETTEYYRIWKQN